LMNEYHWYDYSADFFLLQSGWDVQINQAYCGVASSAAILNSFRPFVSLPVDPLYDPHAYATQLNLLTNECVKENVIHRNDTYDGIFHAPGGLSLEQTKILLECNVVEGWNVTAYHVDPQAVTVDDIRRDLEEALMNPSKRVIVNFDRRGLGQEGGGHFSPVGSYSRKEDAFLVMDVAKYKYPPFWVPAARLYLALATDDFCGDWDYPEAQGKLQDDLLVRPKTRKAYRKAMKKLGCREMYRGYIIVEVTGQQE
jgi:Phytochelatin synthase